MGFAGKVSRVALGIWLLSLMATSAHAYPISCDLITSQRAAENTAMNYIAHTAANRKTVSTFKATKFQKLHLDGYREVETFIKYSQYYYTVYVEIDPLCNAKVTKRSNARP